MSTVFQWNEREMDNLYESCRTDEVTDFIKMYLHQKEKTLESGCGSGRYVKFLHDSGWDVVGIEISKDTVDMVNEKWPHINVIQGDASNTNFEDNTFYNIISLGVVEHFTEGPDAPLKEMYRTLKKDGIALITVPYLNDIRKLKVKLWIYEITKFRKSLSALIREGKKININRLTMTYKYSVYPAYGDFFEYRLDKKQFADAVSKAGFKIIKHTEIQNEGGLFYDFNPWGTIVKKTPTGTEFTKIGYALDSILRRLNIGHGHSQLIIATK